MEQEKQEYNEAEPLVSTYQVPTTPTNYTDVRATPQLSSRLYANRRKRRIVILLGILAFLAFAGIPSAIVAYNIITSNSGNSLSMSADPALPTTLHFITHSYDLNVTEVDSSSKITVVATRSSKTFDLQRNSDRDLTFTKEDEGFNLFGLLPHSLDITAPANTIFDLHTDSGNVTVNRQAGQLAMGNLNIETGSGKVTIILPSGSGFRLDAHTNSGSVDNSAFTIGNQTEVKSLQGSTITTPNFNLTIKTDSGDVAIKKGN